LRNFQTWVKIICIVFFALLSTQQIAYADQLNNSVKDCIQHPEKCKDSNASPRKAATQKNEAAQVGITIWDFIRMIFATAFVVALLYFLLKFINKKSRSFKSTQLVENLGGTALGANRSVQIVKVGNELFIIGVGENIQLLKEIEDPQERQQILSDYNNRLEQLSQPSDIVTKILEKTKKKLPSNKEDASFSSLFKAQLDELSKGRKKLFDQMERKGSDKQ
jgi:flagellar protein FliO/FliZ